MIYEIHKYEDDDGKTLIQRVPCALEPSLPQGAERIGVAGVRTPAGMAQIEFPIPSDIPMADAFARYGEFARAHLQKLQEEQSKTIQVASALPPSLIQKP